MFKLLVVSFKAVSEFDIDWLAWRVIHADTTIELVDYVVDLLFEMVE